MNQNTEWHTVSLVDVAATPWRNGGGVSRELIAWPPQGEWQWRMSVAEVESSGPFSRFEGVQRWFAVLGGAGVALDIAGKHYTLTPNSAPLSFDGSTPTDCQLLNGPTQDFNLMVLPPSLLADTTATEPCMRRITKPTRITVNAPKVIAVWAIKTWATARFDSEIIKIPPQSLAWRLLEHSAEVSLETDGALWMEIPQ